MSTDGFETRELFRQTITVLRVVLGLTISALLICSGLLAWKVFKR